MAPDGPDVVDRAVDALRAAAVPDGPSPELSLRTRAALTRELTQRPVSRLFIGRPILMRLAASIVLVFGAAWVYRVLYRHSTPAANPLISDVKPMPSRPAPILRPGGGDQTPVSPGPGIPTTGPAPSPTPTPVAPEPELADGIIAGRVTFDGVPPQPAVLASVAMLPDSMPHCGPIYDESLVVAKDGALANVVISVSDGLSSWLPGEFPPRADSAVLDQEGCRFRPHVVALMVGQQLLIRNSDPIQHSVHLLAANNPQGRLGQPSTRQAETDPFGAPEMFQVKCDIHPWMLAWVHVVDNPYFAVTGPDGRFTIYGLPPGSYTLKAWHEQLGVIEQQIIVQPGRGTRINFAFQPSSR